MKGLFVVLLCATVCYCVQGSPLPAEVDKVDDSLDDGVDDSVVESTGVREAKELPVPGRFQGGFIKPRAKINPLFVNSQQPHQTRSGGFHNQQLGVQPVGSQIQPTGGLIHQQLGTKPIAGGFINQQSGIKPVASTPLQGGLINLQQSGLHPSHQGSQQLQISTPVLATVQPEVNHFLPGSQQHHQHHQHQQQQQQIPSGGQISGGILNQQTKVLPVDSHVHTAELITSRNAEVHVKDTLHEKPIEILSQDSDLYPDGSHFNVWESANGIKVQEEGTVKVNGKDEIRSVSGSISYTDADGTPIHLTYIADENGFQPQGDHLPTPPPIPQSVARTLEYIAAHPWVEEDHIKSPSKVTSVKQDLPIIEVA